MKHYTEIIPFELAVKLKEAGFPQTGHAIWYDKDGGIVTLYEQGVNYGPFPEFAAPTYAEVLDWLLNREIVVELFSLYPNWGFEVWTGLVLLSEGEAESFSQVANAAIRRALEFLAEQD